MSGPGGDRRSARWRRRTPSTGRTTRRTRCAGAWPRWAGTSAALRVLDLGAGTGKLTAVLAGLGADVTAVEPDPAMLAELRRGLPSVRALPGPRRRYRCRTRRWTRCCAARRCTGSTCPARCRRSPGCCVPGGALGALWNSDDDRVPWVAGLQDAAEGAASPSLSRRRSEAVSFGPEQFGAALFTPTERAEFANAQLLTADSLVELIGTHSQRARHGAGRARPGARPGPGLPGVPAGDRRRASSSCRWSPRSSARSPLRRGRSP